MNDSKNHAVCARCHFTGDASGQDCTIMSSGVSGSHSASVRRRMAETGPKFHLQLRITSLWVNGTLPSRRIVYRERFKRTAAQFLLR